MLINKELEKNRSPEPERDFLPTGPKRFGQVWTIDPKVIDWMQNREAAPLLFPVVVVSDENRIGELGTYNVAGLHFLPENSASDDLLCTDKDGSMAGDVIAAWLQKTVLDGHLCEYYGELSAETCSRLRCILEGPGPGETRQFTGDPIVHASDARLDYRRLLLEQASVIGVPAEEYLSVLELYSDVLVRFQARGDIELLAAIEENADREFKFRQFDLSWLNPEMSNLIINCASGIKVPEAEGEHIRRQTEDIIKEEGFGSSKAFGKVTSFLHKCFIDTLSPVPLRIMEEKLGEWQKRI